MQPTHRHLVDLDELVKGIEGASHAQVEHAEPAARHRTFLVPPGGTDHFPSVPAARVGAAAPVLQRPRLGIGVPM
jgi:hypothetical protein